jgi:NAD(P)-dependent dehydrogenase (short-subunit alcohol dehydrogenase family)
MSAGRSVVVSGGTGALGRAVVAAFLGAGDLVVVPWVVADEARALEAAWPEPIATGRLLLLEADVAEESGADATARAAGAVSVLVNGVGGFAGGTPHSETPLEVWDRMFRINVRTAAALSRALLPGMLAAGEGVIVNVASQAAFSRPAGLAAYNASKAAVLVLGETLQKEVQDHGVRVHAVAPTTIDTPANRRAMPDADFSTWTPPERIAGVILWLAGEGARTVRGACIPV